jgi:uncharacterized membrane protein
MRLVHGIDVDRVEAAVRAAEQGTSGEIRVALARFYFWGDVRRAAERAFQRLHMERTRQRNGVLILVAPLRRRLAIVGDTGIHEKVGDAYWRGLVSLTAESFRAGELTSGVVHAVEALGHTLAALFPAVPGLDHNELPDTVSVGPERTGGPKV